MISMIAKMAWISRQEQKNSTCSAERLIEAGVDPKTAEKDACRLEHAISNESFQKLKDSLKK